MMVLVQFSIFNPVVTAMEMEKEESVAATVPTMITVESGDVEDLTQRQPKRNLKYCSDFNLSRNYRNGLKGALLGSLAGVPFLGFIAMVTHGQKTIRTADFASTTVCQESEGYNLQFLDPKVCGIILPDTENVDMDLCTRIDSNITVMKDDEEHVCQFEVLCDKMEDESCVKDFLAETRQFGTEPFNCYFSNLENPCTDLQNIDVDSYYKDGKRERNAGIGVLAGVTAAGALFGLRKGCLYSR